MNILFINGSPNKNGNTKALAEKMLKGKAYETLNLTDYRIGSYGQNFQFYNLSDEVIDKMKAADVIVVGSPLYWHNICGSVRNVLDRFYGKVEQEGLSGRTLYFLFQGATPRTMDVRSRRIYNETFCWTLWNGIWRNGNKWR